MGPQGPQGDRGPRGEKGNPGNDGRDGRDAAELDVLPTIAASREYARGTFASYFGGLWRAARLTDPVEDGADAEALQKAGWSVVVEGLADLQVEQRTEREFVVVQRSSSGRVREFSFRVPVMIERGIFSEGKHYEVGDFVTFGGSGFVCQKDGTTQKPGMPGADEWRLAIKRGRDGKDGRNGKDGERGPRGKSWNEA